MKSVLFSSLDCLLLVISASKKTTIETPGDPADTTGSFSSHAFWIKY